jgi:hypothetical protein
MTRICCPLLVLVSNTVDQVQQTVGCLGRFAVFCGGYRRFSDCHGRKAVAA